MVHCCFCRASYGENDDNGSVFRRPDVVHVHEPDLSLLIAIIAKLLLLIRGKRCIVIHDMHEFPPGESVDNAPRMLRAASFLCLFGRDFIFNKFVDFVVTANSIVAGYALTMLNARRVTVIYNAPDLSFFPQTMEAPTPNSRDRPLILCHEGVLSFDRGLTLLIDVVERLGDRVNLKIVGKLPEAEQAWLDSRLSGSCNSVHITGWLPYRRVGEALKGADVGLIFMEDSIGNRLSGPPNKLFNYMNAGLAVISVRFFEIESILTETGAGIVVKERTVDAMVAAIQQYIEDPDILRQASILGRDAIRNHYNWSVMAGRLRDLYLDAESMLSATSTLRATDTQE